MGKAATAAGLLLLFVFIGGAALFFFYPKNLARRPPELDALRTATMKQTHLEAEFLLDTNVLGEPDFEGNVKALFTYVPASADKAELERTVRALVKEHLPQAK